MADVFAVQDEIAQAIASALQVKLSGTPAALEQYKPSLPAYEALLKARHYLNQFRPDQYPRIKECFEQAIALDPKFALAHCEYGIYFLSMTVILQERCRPTRPCPWCAPRRRRRWSWIRPSPKGTRCWASWQPFSNTTGKKRRGASAWRWLTIRFRRLVRSLRHGYLPRTGRAGRSPSADRARTARRSFGFFFFLRAPDRKRRTSKPGSSRPR